MKSIKDILNQKKGSSKDGNKIENDNKTIIKISQEVIMLEVKNLSIGDVKEIFFGRKKIIIKTAHPAVASEIWRKKEKILKKINELVGGEIIENIIVK